MAKIVPPNGFTSWYYIHATIYAIQMNEANQPAALSALADRFERGLISELNLSSTNASTYTIKFREKTSTQTLTLNDPDYLVLRADDTLNVLSDAVLRTEYTDKLSTGVYLDQGAVLRI